MTAKNQSPLVENAARTAAYHATLESRRAELRSAFARIFAKPQGFVWEVGCGHGHFLTAYAMAHPEKLCVGIDIASDRIDRALKKRDRARLPNLEFLHADARLFLECLPDHAHIEETFVLFPDPWPKLRHHKHRVLQPDFLSALADRSPENARLCFRTDHGPYYHATRSAIAAHPAWQIAPEPWPFEFVTVFQSRAASFQSLVARRRPREPGISLAAPKCSAAN